jgi:iron complex transport system substrate-binding protein
MNRITIICLIFIFSLGLPAIQSAEAEESNSTVQVVDFRGKSIRISKPAERIVCLIESALSGLYMLGAERQIAGVPVNIYNSGVNKWYAPLDERIRTKKLPAPGNWDFVNLESVIALQPDLVLIWSEQTETIAALEERGVPVFGILLKSKEDVYREIEALGKLTGKTKRAAELIDYSKKELERFAARLPADLKKTSVYYMWAQGNLETSCGGSTVNDLISLAGGQNVCAGIASEHLVTNLEKILSWNPDLVVMWYNERKSPQDILDDPQWRTVAAVKNGRVHEFPEVFLCDLWTLKFQYTVKMVAKWTHPELFRDIDLESEKKEMLTTLYGRTIEEN